MSKVDRKQSKGQRAEEMARKREERAAKRAYRKELKSKSYLDEDENFESFQNQLAKLGLELRDIPGDGNCLFRALADQFEGHTRNHLNYRQQVCDYMKSHRDDFEPFMENEVPFTAHVTNLSKPGTYAGNDAIVAFARLHSAKVCIHQLSQAIWQIDGSDGLPSHPELHISYHNGDHYSSVRRVGDNTSEPARIRLQNSTASRSQPKDSGFPAKNERSRAFLERLKTMKEEPEPDYDLPSEGASRSMANASLIEDDADLVAYIASATGYYEFDDIHSLLLENGHDADATLLQLTQELNEDDFYDSRSSHRDHLESSSGYYSNSSRQSIAGDTKQTRTKQPQKHLTNAQRKEKNKREKEKRTKKTKNGDDNEDDDEGQERDEKEFVTLNNGLGSLSI